MFDAFRYRAGAKKLDEASMSGFVVQFDNSNHTLCWLIFTAAAKKNHRKCYHKCALHGFN